MRSADTKFWGIPFTNDDDGGLIVLVDDQVHRPLQ